MKKIAIVIFDNFTDIDLFLMWDLLGRNKTDWTVRILGEKESHISTHGLSVQTHGRLSEVSTADVVLFSSGKGAHTIIHDKNFLNSISLNSKTQIIGSICAGALILAQLGLLKNIPATTHPKAKAELNVLGVKTIELPLVCHENIATAGGCLSAIYLVGWVVEKLFGQEKRDETLKEIFPVAQSEIYAQLVHSSIMQGTIVETQEFEVKA